MKATVTLDPNKKPLTEKQHEFLLFLQHFLEEHGFPPTMKEMCEKMQLSSTNAATQYVQALERKGYIRRTIKGASRGIQIVDFTPRPRHTIHNTIPYTLAPSGEGGQQFAHQQSHHQHFAHQSMPPGFSPMPSVKNVIIAGNGSAAQPLSVFLSPKGQVKIDTEFFCQDASAQLFCAVVSDDGMNTDALRQGDIVLARQQFSADDGELVVAILHDVLIVRRFAAATRELVASVRGFPPVSLDKESAHVTILGVVVGMMRAMKTVGL